MNGNKSYYLKNAHGDVVGTTGTDGNITNQYKFDAFGKPLGTQIDNTNPFGYCGEYYDKETGLVYLRARYYDPATSRMLSEDPARNGLNWYIYCHNDPINFKDSTGLAEYNINAPFPTFTHDSGFSYNHNAVATDADYKSWKEWNTKAWQSGLAPWLQDASKMYKNYLSNTGNEQCIDYERAYKEDKVIRQNIDGRLKL